MQINKHSIHAFSNDALAYDDATTLVERLQKKQVNPLELVHAAIKRAQLIDPSLCAIEEQGYDQAITQANQHIHSQDSFFSGIPIFIKDNINLAGFHTRHGSRALTNSSIASKNDPYINQLSSLELITLGKTRLPEFGLNASTEFSHAEPTRNPWHLDYSCGASSGGSASLVAAGVVPFAHANDGGGSIRIPAACTGLVGLKTSRNRHIRSLASQSLPVDLINEGILTRSVRDTARFHYEMEKYYRNQQLKPIGLIEQANTKRKKIGVLIDSVTGFKTDKETRLAVENTAKLLSELGHHVFLIENNPIVEQFSHDFLLYWSLMGFLLKSFGKKALHPGFNKKHIEPLTEGLANYCKKRFFKIPIVIHRLKKSYFQYANIFNDMDLILTPTLAHITPKLGYLNPAVDFEELIQRLINYAGFTPLANATGGPAISLPLASSTEGLPIGIQLFANHGDESTLLEIAYELEEACPFKQLWQ